MRTLKLFIAAAALCAGSAAYAQAARTGMQGVGYQQSAGLNIAPNQPADLFHAGGVAACDGCHVMHNANGGQAKSTTGLGASVAPWSNVTNAYLLQGSDQSSTCLICHAGTSSATSPEYLVADTNGSALPTGRTPGGDFGWLTENGFARNGHNVIARDFPGAFPVDGMNRAPGGAWAGGAGLRAFACSSCHDPHGRYRMQVDAARPYGVTFVGPNTNNILPDTALPIAGTSSFGAAPTGTYAVGSYRLLAGVNYAPASNSSYAFVNDPPVAVAPLNYNRSEATSEVRVAYGTGMSEWCQNCHTSVHLNGYTSGVAGLRHPAGSTAKLRASQIAVYNTYLSSGRLDSTLTSNYSSLVPFEQGRAATSLAALVADAANIAATDESTVMCLSCHRAHAGAFDSMLRWDGNATFLTDGAGYTATPGGGGTGPVQPRSVAQAFAGYYDRPVGAATANGTTIGRYQRSLCNKCHGKD